MYRACTAIKRKKDDLTDRNDRLKVCKKICYRRIKQALTNPFKRNVTDLHKILTVQLFDTKENA